MTGPVPDNDQRPAEEHGQATLADRVDAADLMTDWAAHRDAHRWDHLGALFAPDATIELTWFTGAATDWVDGLRRQPPGPLESKHVMARPVVAVAGDRMSTETNAIVVLDQPELGLGAVCHLRFLDRLTRVAGRWRIAHRASVYDFSALTALPGDTAVDPADLARFPRQYAALAHLLARSGVHPDTASPVRGSDGERHLRDAQQHWLSGQPR